MNRKLKRNIATLATFFIMILLFCVRITGVHAHMIVGLLFIVGLGIHTFKRWGRLLKCPTCFRVADIVAAAALLAVLISGFLIPFFKGAIVVLMIHKLASVVLAASIAVHIWQHMPKRKRK